MRMIAAEITREKLTLRLHEEIPYQLTVETEAWAEQPDGSARIDCTIYVSRPSQKAIIIGRGGSRLREVGTTAREQIEQLLGQRVHLDLHVKVAKDWQRDPKQLGRLGFDFS